MPDFPVPVRIILKNFCSHTNNVVEFGAPSEKVFVRGETGQGKSQIFNAIKYALGKKKENDEEVFTYDEIVEDGEKKKSYRNETQIILTLKNSGSNPLKQFPADAEFSIEANFVRGKRTQYYLVQPDGKSKSLISREDLRQFGRYDDPLLFVDQAQTSIWTQMNSAERFKRVSSLIGIEEYQRRVKETLQELNQANNRLIEHTGKYDIAKIRFNEIEEKYKRYQEKTSIIVKLALLHKERAIASLLETFQLFKTQEDSLHECDNLIQQLHARKTSAESEIDAHKRDILKSEETLAEITKDKPKLETEQKSKSVTVTNFERDLDACNQGLAQYNLNPKNYSADQITKGFKNTTEDLNETNAQIFSLNKQLRQTKKQMQDMLADQPDLPKDILKLTNELKKSHIPYEMVFSVIDLLPNVEKWRDIIEAFLGWDKKAIIVEPHDRLRVEQINSANDLDVIILAPRKEIQRKNRVHSKFKTWEDILQIQTESIKENTVKQILDYLFGGVVFADTPEEKEIILESMNVQVLCLNHYKYDSYSQRKIREPYDYLIGKNAKKLEISRLETLVKKLTGELTSWEAQKKKGEENVAKFRVLDRFLELQDQEPKMETFRRRLEKIKDQLEQIIIRMALPKEYKERLNRELIGQTEVLNKTLNELSNKQEEFDQIQRELTQTSTLFQAGFNEIHDNPKNYEGLITAPFYSSSITDFLITYQDTKITYKGLKREFMELKICFKIPESSVNQIKQDILIQDALLKSYSDVAPDTPEIYKKMKDTLEQFERELQDYHNEYNRCDAQHSDAQDTLSDRLNKWRHGVNKNFSKVMQGLQLDGELNFEDLDGAGTFGLNFNVANSVGGAKSLIEKANFSGGEKQRTNIAFIIAIIMQTQYTYLIWDEPDSAIGEPYREMLAKVIEQFFPYRKLILASPQRIVQGYLKVFDQIIEVFKDGNNQSHISKVLLTDEYRKEKGVLNVKAPPKV